MMNSADSTSFASSLISSCSETVSQSAESIDSGVYDNSFKERKPLSKRRDEVAVIMTRFPAKIPVIVERFDRESALPSMDRTKFLIPQELSMSQFVTLIRNRLLLDSSQTVFLLVNNRSIISMSRTVAEVYREERDPDGYLYVTYASQEAFGSDVLT